MIGARAFIAMSCSFVIFSACVSDSEPPNTVKSLANTKVLRPLTVPQPVTTPSPGTLLFSMPNSLERCSTNMSNSSNEPLSSSSSIRSRAVSLPRACWASMRFSPPPNLALARRSSRESRICFMSGQPVLVSCLFLWVSTRPFRPRKGLPEGVSVQDQREGIQKEQMMAETGTDGMRGAVTGGVRYLLLLEGFALFAAMILLYFYRGGSWWLFAALFLAPD